MTTYPTPHPNWRVAARIRALDALQAVLEGVEGVTRVFRGADEEDADDAIAESDLPAIVIDEVRDRWVWVERHGQRVMRFDAEVLLDLQLMSQRTDDAAEAAISLARALFVDAVQAALVNNSKLTVQLDDEEEPTPHVHDCAEAFTVGYAPITFPLARAVVGITLTGLDVFDNRSQTAWTTLITQIDADPTDDFDNDPSVVTSTTTIGE